MANHGYMSITGKKQSLISSGCSSQVFIGNKCQIGHFDEIMVLAYSHDMIAGSDGTGRSQGASATPHVRCCHVYPIQPPEYRGARHHYGDALSTTDAASYCRFARPSPQHH
nr:type VI secretion system tube protein TssD [Pseudomonas lundensis]